MHCVKSVRIRNYSGRYFPAFGLNTDQNNSEQETFYAVILIGITNNKEKCSGQRCKFRKEKNVRQNSNSRLPQSQLCKCLRVTYILKLPRRTIIMTLYGITFTTKFDMYVKRRNIRKSCEICSKLTMKTVARLQ